MRCLFSIVAGLLLCGAALGVTALAQEVPSDTTRKVVSSVPPVYPDLARTVHLEGTVKLRVKVAPNGAATSVEPIGGSPVLVRAAENAVYKWKWARTNEKSTELVELRFHLE
jgi:outer membrane biosynthesis protein TonB